MAEQVVVQKRLGKLPAKADPRDLQFARFAMLPKKLPARTTFWNRRRRFPARTFHNRDIGDCTRAKQAIAAMRMERIETRRTPQIDDAEIRRVYFEMTARLYGGGDTGAYEEDALSEWRRPDLTFRDRQGRTLTIDAYVRVDPKDLDAVRSAIHVSGAKGIAVCFALPTAWSTMDPPLTWDLPHGQPMTGPWEPNSWGGHSMWADAYSTEGIRVIHTWYEGDDFVLDEQVVTWGAVAGYMDEAYLVIDSFDEWRKDPQRAKVLDFAGIRKQINRVSSYKLR